MLSENNMIDRPRTNSPSSNLNNSDIVIKASNIHKTYLLGLEGVAALRGVSFEIHAGEFVTILGNSGGGKTTLLNIIGTIDKPTKGYLTICKQKINSNTSDELLSGLRLNYLGFVFQTFNLISSLTAQENVELPMTLRGELSSQQIKQRAKELLCSVGMDHRLSHYPNQLSGGEQQRVTIARALANHPKILLLDEPTGDLDSKNTDNVMNILLDLNEKHKITLIMVTHDVNLKYYSDRVLRVLDGKIVKQETIEESIRKSSRETLRTRILEKNRLQEQSPLSPQDQVMDRLESQIKSKPYSSVGELEKAGKIKDPVGYGVVGWLLEKHKRDELEKTLEQKMHLK